MALENSLGTLLDDTEDQLLELAYAAYLITFDPVMSVAAVMHAVGESAVEMAGMCSGLKHSRLQRETIKASISYVRGQIRRFPADPEPTSRESEWPRDRPGLSASRRRSGDFSGELMGIVDVGPRIAFVLHHVLGYSIGDSSLLLDIGMPDVQAWLKSAYVQLAFGKRQSGVRMGAACE